MNDLICYQFNIAPFHIPLEQVDRIVPENGLLTIYKKDGNTNKCAFVSFK